MVVTPFKKISWGILPAALFLLSLYFTACTQGQGPAGTPEKVTTAGAETPPVDVCEKPENLDKILCQWVATELNAPPTSSSPETKVAVHYDAQGRIFKMVAMDVQGNETTLINLVYDGFGLHNLTMFSNPQPANSSNYTKKQTVTTNHDASTGAITSIITEQYENNVIQEGGVTVYAADGLSSISTEKDSTMNPVKQIDRVFTKDPATGKNVKIDEKTYDLSGTPPVKGPLDTWSITDIYRLPNGRLDRVERDEQDCTSKPCDPLNPIDPTQQEVIQVAYDDAGRMASHTTTETDSSGQESAEVWEATYEIKTQAKIAGTHPIEFLITTMGMAGYEGIFGERDIFSTYNYKEGTGPKHSISLRWVRLWEALPEGKPPGS